MKPPSDEGTSNSEGTDAEQSSSAIELPTPIKGTSGLRPEFLHVVSYKEMLDLLDDEETEFPR
jgi:hypothetical protein